ncbi:unnamed protein product [Nyctereutes procyonoides]|uniref:(raccoon dog) hypothetical protein n=1 Tax=Nyctereutes procyonoides TaxID=34880 RepID=A0A811ZFG9_NYCPR|nr:unnamed protein product [Nyctereutes procyonoides]
MARVVLLTQREPACPSASPSSPAPRSPAAPGDAFTGGSEPLGVVSSSPRGEHVRVGATCRHDSPSKAVETPLLSLSGKLLAQAGIFPPDFLRMHVGWEPSRVLGPGTICFLRSEARVPPGDPPGAGPSPPLPIPVPRDVGGTVLKVGELPCSPRGNRFMLHQEPGEVQGSRSSESPEREGSGCRLHGLPGRPTGPGIKFRPSRGARAPVTPATRSPLLPGFRLGPSSFLLFGLRRPPQSLSSLSLGAQVTSPFNHEAL